MNESINQSTINEITFEKANKSNIVCTNKQINKQTNNKLDSKQFKQITH